MDGGEERVEGRGGRQGTEILVYMLSMHHAKFYILKSMLPLCLLLQMVNDN